MTEQLQQRDLVVLVADKQMEFSVRGLLERRRALRIQPISFEIFAHPAKDPGCRRKSHDFLRPFHRQYRFALVMFDREGCGSEGQTREELEAEIEQRLAQSGWENRAASVVLDPELEIWVWSDSPEVDRALDWSGRQPNLRSWLKTEGFVTEEGAKPEQPKEAMQRALKIARRPRSASIYRDLASKISVDRCTDAAFIKFKETLQRWFGES